MNAFVRAVAATTEAVRGAIEHRFGTYGGQYVPETLMPALAELEAAWSEAREDAGYRAELDLLLRDFAGRPTPLYRAGSLSDDVGHSVYLKREDLLHTGAHKINNALGQALLAKRMGKQRIIAETGAGQHGVATATVCALLGLECIVYMGDRGHAPPEAERLAHGAAGREVVARRGGHAHAQGRDQRGDPRLGHQRRDDPLHHRLRASARSRIRRWCATSSVSSATRRASRCSSARAGCPTG